MISGMLLAGVGLLSWPALMLMAAFGLRLMHLRQIRSRDLLVYSHGQVRKPGRILRRPVIKIADRRRANGRSANLSRDSGRLHR